MPLKQKKDKLTLSEKILQASVIQSWWVFLFLVFGFVFFQHTIKKKNSNIAQLENQLSFLENKKSSLENEQDDLLLRIHSQSDPNWVELILRKELGLVPDGYIKIHFTNES